MHPALLLEIQNIPKTIFFDLRWLSKSLRSLFISTFLTFSTCRKLKIFGVYVSVSIAPPPPPPHYKLHINMFKRCFIYFKSERNNTLPNKQLHFRIQNMENKRVIPKNLAGIHTLKILNAKKTIFQKIFTQVFLLKFILKSLIICL